jgi:hypothetical protein
MNGYLGTTVLMLVADHLGVCRWVFPMQRSLAHDGSEIVGGWPGVGEVVVDDSINDFAFRAFDSSVYYGEFRDEDLVIYKKTAPKSHGVTHISRNSLIATKRIKDIATSNG